MPDSTRDAAYLGRARSSAYRRRPRGRRAAGSPRRSAASSSEKRLDRGDRPEGLLVHDPGRERHVREHGRLEEVALVADAVAARAAARRRPPRRPARSPPWRRRGDRAASGPIVVAGLHAVADLEGLRGGRELLGELVHRSNRAPGSGSARRRPGRHCGTCWPESTDTALSMSASLEHDRGRVAAELHRDALHVLAGERRRAACRSAVEPVNVILRMIGCGIR